MIETMDDHDWEELVKDTARLLEDHKGEQTVIIDVSQVNSWTRYFVITTVMSTGHLRGLVRELREFFSERAVQILHKHKQIDDSGWELLDCGGMIIHLMSKTSREFYDLEKLWHSGQFVPLKPTG